MNQGLVRQGVDLAREHAMQELRYLVDVRLGKNPATANRKSVSVEARGFYVYFDVRIMDGGGLIDFDDVNVAVDGFWSGCRGLSLICRLYVCICM